MNGKTFLAVFYRVCPHLLFFTDLLYRGLLPVASQLKVSAPVHKCSIGLGSRDRPSPIHILMCFFLSHSVVVWVFVMLGQLYLTHLQCWLREGGSHPRIYNTWLRLIGPFIQQSRPVFLAQKELQNIIFPPQYLAVGMLFIVS